MLAAADITPGFVEAADGGGGCTGVANGPAALAGGAVGLPLLGDGADVFGAQLLGVVVALELDDVDGRRRGAGDGGDAGGVEGFISGEPFRHDNCR